MISFLQQWGILGLFIGSFLSATVVPFSSDVLYVGILATGISPWLCFLFASFGLGWLGKWQWIEKWFHVKQETLEKQKSRIDKYGSLLALLTWLPFVGDLFAIALGFYRLSPWKCAFFMLIGK